jgi:hypothetical protein
MPQHDPAPAEPVTDEALNADPMRVTCAVCRQPGRLTDMNDKGFLIVHPGRFFPCRAPR